MPVNMISELDLHVSSVTGSAVRFAANVERTVPDVLVPEALARGARIVGETTKEFTPAQGEVAMESVKEAISQMVEKGDPSDFDSKGRPKMAALKAILGDGVTAAMRDAAMEE